MAKIASAALAACSSRLCARSAFPFRCLTIVPIRLTRRELVPLSANFTARTSNCSSLNVFKSRELISTSFCERTSDSSSASSPDSLVASVDSSVASSDCSDSSSVSSTASTGSVWAETKSSKDIGVSASCLPSVATELTSGCDIMNIPFNAGKNCDR